jgi:hypothetical protein
MNTNTQDDNWVDGMIDQLLGARNRKPGTPVDLSVQDATSLCNHAREIFMNQPMLLELGAPIKICGDVHGQYTDLLRLFEYGGFPPEVCNRNKCVFVGFETLAFPSFLGITIPKNKYPFATASPYIYICLLL